MTQFKGTRQSGCSRRPAFAVVSASACALLLGLAGTACREKAPNAPSPDPKAAASAGGASATGNAACDQFIAKLCGRTGDKSALCGSAKTLGSVLPASACNAGVADFATMERQIDVERKVCTDLMERLCTDLGPTTDTCQLVRDQTPQFPREQCQQLTTDYPQVLAELKQKEAANQPLSTDVQARIAASDAPSFGPANAKVTIVEFSDFQCPFCQKAADVAHKIKEKYGDKVRFVFRQFPLPMHENARPAAEAAMEAHRQGKFWEYHDLLFANQRQLTRDSLEKLAAEAHMDIGGLKKALDTSTNKAKVDADVTLGESVAVNGTPTMFINGKRVPNPTEFEPVAKLIDAALGA